MKNIIKSITLLLVLLAVTSVGYSQDENKINIVGKLKSLTKKGDYTILEVRLNNEDEFRTIEGGSSSLARLAVFTGNNEGAEVLSKGFDGINSIVAILNDLKANGWILNDVYSIKGESLIVTHYILERKK
ncbi:MAG: hypothetical protein KDD29_00610 [Flavobacteriales bacterium]|nr:hypothetical protein [Flavobacteriales bacterium]MCB9335968.1 hypothetical protein [Flavobacteriales bacterium]